MYSDRIILIETLVAVVDTGSFSLAAKQLGISQSTVSRRIAALEKKLKGKPIVKRGTRWLGMTEQAEAYVNRVKNILMQLDSAETILQNYSHEPEGLLRVSLLPALGTALLIPALAQLHKKHSKLTLKIQLSDATINMKEQPYDIAVRLIPSSQSGIESVELSTAELKLCGSTKYFEKNGLPGKLEDLKQHTLIAHSAHVNQRVLKIGGQRLDIPSYIKPSIYADDFRAIHQLLLSDTGISLLPDYLIKNELDAGLLQTCECGLKTPLLSIFALYRSDIQQSAKVSATLKTMQELFKK